jgi:hypothetical protein
MSELWLLIALVGTFMTIFLVGVIVDMGARERARPMTLLEAQIGHVSDSVNLRDEELRGSAVDRIFVPRFVGGDPPEAADAVRLDEAPQQLLLYAGSRGLDAERIAALKIVGGIDGCSSPSRWAGPADRRDRKIIFVGSSRSSVPAAGVRRQHGQGPAEGDPATAPGRDRPAHDQRGGGAGVRRGAVPGREERPGPLAEEIGRQLQEMQIGVSRSDAFRHLGDRTNVQELNAFVLS